MRLAGQEILQFLACNRDEARPVHAATSRADEEANWQCDMLRTHQHEMRHVTFRFLGMQISLVHLTLTLTADSTTTCTVS